MAILSHIVSSYLCSGYLESKFMLNKINLEALNGYIESIRSNADEAITSVGVTANWKGGVNTEITTHPKQVGSSKIARQFSFMIGEREELLGDNLNPNPRDYMLAGMAGCMMVG